MLHVGSCLLFIWGWIAAYPSEIQSDCCCYMSIMCAISCTKESKIEWRVNWKNRMQVFTHTLSISSISFDNPKDRNTHTPPVFDMCLEGCDAHAQTYNRTCTNCWDIPFKTFIFLKLFICRHVCAFGINGTVNHMGIASVCMCADDAMQCAEDTEVLMLKHHVALATISDCRQMTHYVASIKRFSTDASEGCVCPPSTFANNWSGISTSTSGDHKPCLATTIKRY